MIPHNFVILEKFPQNKNGKIDRMALSKLSDIVEIAPMDINTPQTFQEKILALIWSDTLKVPKVGIHDNFFYLGGDSLTSLQMINKANNAGINITVAQLLDNPTIYSLAALALNGVKQKSSLIIPINEKGNNPVLFFVPAITGDINSCKKLSYYLGDEQPLYFLVPVGSVGKTSPLTKIEDIAAHHLKEIIKVQADGPYYLTGFCFGGFVIYELAKQLEAIGKEVGILIIIDSYVPGSYYPKPGLSLFQMNKARIKNQLDHMQNMSFGKKIKHVRKRMKKGWKVRVVRPLARLTNKFYVSKGKNIVSKYISIDVADDIAWNSYKFKEYNGDVSIIRANDINSGSWIYHEAGMGWEKLVRGKLKFIDVGGNHSTILKEPNIKQVAGAIKSSLSEVYAKNLVEA